MSFQQNIQTQKQTLQENLASLQAAQATACSRGQCGGADFEAGIVPYQNEIATIGYQIAQLESQEFAIQSVLEENKNTVTVQPLNSKQTSSTIIEKHFIQAERSPGFNPLQKSSSSSSKSSWLILVFAVAAILVIIGVFK